MVENKIFVGGLSQASTNESLNRHFQQFGEVDAIVMMDRQTGRSRGFGFATFTDPNSVAMALSIQQVIDGKQVECKACQEKTSRPNGGGGDVGGGGALFQATTTSGGGGGVVGGQASDNVFVSQLPSGLNEEQVNQLFSQYGTVTSVKIVSKPDQEGTAALVRFATEAEAAFIVEGMNGNIPQGLSTPVQTRFAGTPGGGKGGGAPAGGAGFPGGVERASPYPQTQLPQSAGKGLGKPGDIPMEQIVKGLEESGGLPGGDGRDKSQMIEVFVLGLPADTTDLHMYRMFAPFGQIAPKGANVMTDMSGACKGFGFVNFLAIESAQLAIQTLNGAILPNKRVLKVELKAAGKGQKGAN